MTTTYTVFITRYDMTTEVRIVFANKVVHELSRSFADDTSAYRWIAEMVESVEFNKE